MGGTKTAYRPDASQQGPRNPTGINLSFSAEDTRSAARIRRIESLIDSTYATKHSILGGDSTETRHVVIVPPEGTYSRNDIKLIELLDRCLSDVPDGSRPTNSLFAAHVTETEIEIMLNLVERKIEDKEFLLASALIDAVSNRRQDQIRELYLSGRVRRGKSRALASKQNAEFLARLGIHLSPQRWYVPTDTMSFEHFLRMERRAFQDRGISPKVADLALRFISLNSEEIEGVREGRRRLSENFLQAAFLMAKSSISRMRLERDNMADAQQLAGLLIVVVNIGVLYTTRDWSVTGTLSTIAGGLGAMTPNRRQ